jgi:8-oxo-dGTP pyrophosphatase MutT (NUDIX family)
MRLSPTVIIEAMKKRNTIIPAIYLVLKRKDHIFLLRRSHTGFQDGNYSFIAGHVEKGESPRSAVCREAKEEAGIVVKEHDLKFEQVLFRTSFSKDKNAFDPSAPDRVDLFFSTEKWQEEPTNTEPEKCDDMRWFLLAHLPENIFPIVESFLEKYPEVSQFEEAGY